MKVISYAIVGLMIVMAFLPMTTKALNTEGIPVEDTAYYDHSPQIFGDYIVWLRGIDTNLNGAIAYNEPRWVMLHWISTGETTNITPTDAVYLTGTNYHHARAIRIWRNYIIYEQRTGIDNWRFQTYLYNINTNTTSQISSGLTFTSGGLCDIYGSWVSLTHYETAYRQGYLYNLETEEFRTIISGSESGIGFDGSFLSNENLVYLKRDYLASPETKQTIIYNLNTGKRVIIDASDVGIGYNLYPSDVYENYIGLNILEITPSTKWNLYILDISFINWSAMGNSVTYGWNDIQDYLINVDVNFDYDISGGRIYRNTIVYQRFETTRSTLSNIYAVNFNTNTTYEINPFVSHQISPDIFNDRIVWMDNRDESIPLPTDATHDFDIYRTKSLAETIPSIFMNLLPIFMIGGVFVIVGLAAKSFAGGFL